MFLKIREATLKTLIVSSIVLALLMIAAIWTELSDLFSRSLATMFLLLGSAFMIVSATLVAERNFSLYAFLPFNIFKKKAGKKRFSILKIILLLLLIWIAYRVFLGFFWYGWW